MTIEEVLAFEEMQIFERTELFIALYLKGLSAVINVEFSLA